MEKIGTGNDPTEMSKQKCLTGNSGNLCLSGQEHVLRKIRYNYL